MKKISLMAVAAVLALLAGCGSYEKNKEQAGEVTHRGEGSIQEGFPHSAGARKCLRAPGETEM